MGFGISGMSFKGASLSKLMSIGGKFIGIQMTQTLVFGNQQLPLPPIVRTIGTMGLEAAKYKLVLGALSGMPTWVRSIAKISLIASTLANSMVQIPSILAMLRDPASAFAIPDVAAISTVTTTAAPISGAKYKTLDFDILLFAGTRDETDRNWMVGTVHRVNYEEGKRAGVEPGEYQII